MEILSKNLVKDLLITQFAFDNKKLKAKSLLDDIIKQIDRPTVVLMDLTDSIIDHYFCEAFGPIYDVSFESDCKVDIIFKLHDYQIDNLLKGLLMYHKITYKAQDDGDLVHFFKLNATGLKVLINGNSEVKFIGNIDTKSECVLAYLDDHGSGTSDAIYVGTNVCGMEEFVSLLKQLAERRLIYKNDNIYYSVKHILTSA